MRVVRVIVAVLVAAVLIGTFAVAPKASAQGGNPCPVWGGQQLTPLFDPFPVTRDGVLYLRVNTCRYERSGIAQGVVPASPIAFNASYRFAVQGNHPWNNLQFSASPGVWISTDAADFFPQSVDLLVPATVLIIPGFPLPIPAPVTAPQPSPAPAPGTGFAPSEVQARCRAPDSQFQATDCHSSRFTQLSESDGRTNPNGVKMLSGQWVWLDLLAEWRADYWDGASARTAVGPVSVWTNEASVRR